MKSKRLNGGGPKRHLLVFETGDAVMQGLRDFARSADIRAAHFTGIGAWQSGTLAFFQWEQKSYLDIPVSEQVEVLAFVGDIAWHHGEPVVHAHAVLGREDGSVRGGHVKEGIVRPTLELALTEGGDLVRRFDPESKLALISP